MLRYFRQAKTICGIIGALRRQLKGTSEIDEKDLNGIHYYLSDDLVKLNGAVIAVTGTNMFGEDIIICDHNFEELSDEAKMFILQHELGHQVLGHVKLLNENPALVQQMNRDRNKKNKTSPIEFEADKYAFEHTSLEAAMETFDAMEKLMKKLGFKDYETKKRRSAILSMVK